MAAKRRTNRINDQTATNRTSDWQERIVVDPSVLVGKPVIKGTRLTVEFIIGLMGEGWSEADILANYPGLTRQDILACLNYARETLQSEKVFPVTA